MVTYIEYGDIFRIEGVVNYAHGCNCAGAMGKGIAVQFKERYPEMYRQYKSLCNKSEFNLGDVFEYNYGSGYVFNLGTQASWRTKAVLDAVDQSVNIMLLLAAEKKLDIIALPKIGAGLGGLNWNDVKRVIESSSLLFPHIALIVVENYKGD